MNWWYKISHRYWIKCVNYKNAFVLNQGLLEPKDVRDCVALPGVRCIDLLVNSMRERITQYDSAGPVEQTCQIQAINNIYFIGITTGKENK